MKTRSLHLVLLTNAARLYLSSFDVLMLPCPSISSFPVIHEPFGLPYLRICPAYVNVLLVQSSLSLAILCSGGFSSVIVERYIPFHSVLLFGGSRKLEGKETTTVIQTLADNRTCSVSSQTKQIAIQMQEKHSIATEQHTGNTWPFLHTTIYVDALRIISSVDWFLSSSVTVNTLHDFP